ncbi:MAG: hypothetical protein QOF64_432, partial [Candidatus Binatota bacterium]|nr:hypothetical protein [Candidatus Binatota bacterium]
MREIFKKPSRLAAAASILLGI